MISKYLFVLFLIVLSQLSLCQVDTKTGFSESVQTQRYLLPDETDMDFYNDSLSSIYSQKFLTVYTFSLFNEVLPNEPLLYAFDEASFIETKSDSKGRLFLIPENENGKTLHIRTTNSDYHQIDTAISWQNLKNQPLLLWFQPRYKIVLRGRTIVGTLPLEGIQVKIIHNKDTMKTSTLSCYTDEEEYWNCLYNGMFIQEIVFDNPYDTVIINLSKDGLVAKSFSITCADYDGKVLPIKMKYKNDLPKVYKNNFLLKVGLPMNDCWMIAFNYRYLLNLGSFNRLGFGMETGMIMTDVEKNIPTFPDLSSGADSLSIIAKSDTSYISTYISPDIFFWINNPQNRRFASYIGLQMPYVINQKKFYFHPYVGTRYYLDMNKAIFGELRYLNYDLDLVNYSFNPYGEAYRNTINEPFNKLYLNIGLMVSF